MCAKKSCDGTLVRKPFEKLEKGDIVVFIPKWICMNDHVRYYKVGTPEIKKISEFKYDIEIPMVEYDEDVTNIDHYNWVRFTGRLVESHSSYPISGFVDDGMYIVYGNSEWNNRDKVMEFFDSMKRNAMNRANIVIYDYQKTISSYEYDRRLLTDPEYPGDDLMDIGYHCSDKQSFRSLSIGDHLYISSEESGVSQSRPDIFRIARIRNLDKDCAKGIEFICLHVGKDPDDIDSYRRFVVTCVDKDIQSLDDYNSLYIYNEANNPKKRYDDYYRQRLTELDEKYQNALKGLEEIKTHKKCLEESQIMLDFK